MGGSTPVGGVVSDTTSLAWSMSTPMPSWLSSKNGLASRFRYRPRLVRNAFALQMPSSEQSRSSRKLCKDAGRFRFEDWGDRGLDDLQLRCSRHFPERGVFARSSGLHDRGLCLLAQGFLRRAFACGEIARGNLPLWNPYLFAGTQLLGGFQAGLLHHGCQQFGTLPNAQVLGRDAWLLYQALKVRHVAVGVCLDVGLHSVQ